MKVKIQVVTITTMARKRSGKSRVWNGMTGHPRPLVSR